LKVVSEKKKRGKPVWQRVATMIFAINSHRVVKYITNEKRFGGKNAARNWQMKRIRELRQSVGQEEPKKRGEQKLTQAPCPLLLWGRGGGTSEKGGAKRRKKQTCPTTKLKKTALG